jgi:hypothetical protein
VRQRSQRREAVKLRLFARRRDHRRQAGRVDQRNQAARMQRANHVLNAAAATNSTSAAAAAALSTRTPNVRLAGTGSNNRAARRVASTDALYIIRPPAPCFRNSPAARGLAGRTPRVANGEDTAQEGDIVARSRSDSRSSSVGRAVVGAVEEAGHQATRIVARTREEAADIWAEARQAAGTDVGRDGAVGLGLATTVAFGVLELPIAAALGAGYALFRRR